MDFQRHIPSPQTTFWALLAVALSLRLWRCLSADLGRDTAICGLMGQSVLRGDFLLFFFGQKFMGALDAYLSAPIYLLLPPSGLTANLLPAVLSLATILGLYLLLRQHFTAVGRLTSLGLSAVPAAIGLYWVTQGKPFYHLAMFLSVFLMELTFRISKSRETRCGAYWPAWGLLAGLIFWVNFLFGVVVAACGLTLVWGRRRWIGIRPAARAALGLLVGLAPLMIFLLTQGRPHLGIIPPGERFTFLERLSLIFFNSLPIVLGFTPQPGTGGLSLWSWPFLGYLLLLVFLIAAGLGLLVRGWKSKDQGLLLPLFLVGFNLGAAFLGGRPQDYRFTDPRYFTPLFLALPFFWAQLAEWFSRRPGVFAGWLALLLTVHLSGYDRFRAEEPSPLLGITTGYHGTREKTWTQLIGEVRRAGLDALYAEDFGLAFLAAGRPPVSTMISSIDFTGAARVDGSLQPGFVQAPEGAFHLLGLDHRLLSAGIRHSFVPPGGAERLLDIAGGSISTHEGQNLGAVLGDGDLSTFFQTPGSNPDGRGFTLDLGREETVGGLALIPSDYQQVPAGMRIEAAGKDRVFHRIREVRDYFGPAYLSGPRPFIAVRYPRIEAYFPPRTLRYLRLTQVGRIAPDWAVNEILLFGPQPGTGKMPWPQADAALLKMIQAQPLNRLYADAWPSARIYSRLPRPPQLLLPNQNTDPFGSKIPHPSEPLGLDPAPGNGLLIFNRETATVRDRLTRSGIAFIQKSAGRYTLFLLNGRQESLPLAPRQVNSDLNPEAARGLVQGLPPGRRWSTGVPQRPGMGLSLDLGETRWLQWVRLECPRFPQDFPRGLEAHISPDGRHWEKAPLQLAEPLVFTGQVLLLFRGPVQRYRFYPAVQTRFLRLRLTASDPQYWWSIERIQVGGAPGVTIP